MVEKMFVLRSSLRRFSHSNFACLQGTGIGFGKPLASLWQAFGKGLARGWQVYGKGLASPKQALELAKSLPDPVQVMRWCGAITVQVLAYTRLSRDAHYFVSAVAWILPVGFVCQSHSILRKKSRFSAKFWHLFRGY